MPDHRDYDITAAAEYGTAIARRLEQEHDDPAARLEALAALPDPATLWRTHVRETGAEQSADATRDASAVARGLQRALRACARPAIDASPDLGTLTERLRTALRTAHALQASAEPRLPETPALGRLARTQAGIDLDELPTWGDEPPAESDALSWDAERVLTRGRTLAEPEIVLRTRIQGEADRSGSGS